MPVNYNLKKLGLYALLAVGLFVISLFVKTSCVVLNLAVKTAFLVIFVLVVIKYDLPLKEIPYLNRFVRK